MRRSLPLVLGALLLAPSAAMASRPVAIAPLAVPGAPLAVSPTGAWLALARPLGARVRVVLVRRDGTGERRLEGSWAPRPRVELEDDGSARIVGLRTSDRAARLYHVPAGAIAPAPYAGIAPSELLGAVPGSDAVVAHVEHRVVFVLADGVLRQVGRRHGRRDGREVAIARDGSLIAVVGTTAALTPRARVRVVWIAGGDGTAPVRTDLPVPLRSLRFSGDLSRAVGIAGDGRGVVRFARRGRRLVRVGRIDAATPISRVAISGDGSTIATVRGARRRVHAGAWRGPLRTRPAWLADGAASPTFELRDDGAVATRVTVGRTGVGGRFLRLDADAGLALGCTGTAVSVLDHGGALGCDATDDADCLDPTRTVLQVAFPDGAVALLVPGSTAVLGSARFAADGRSALFAAVPCAGGDPATYLATIGAAGRA